MDQPQLRPQPGVEFSRPTRQIGLMLAILGLVGLGAGVLAAQIAAVFFANPYLNGFIGGVFVLGVLATFWQVGQLMAATRWLRQLRDGSAGQSLPPPPRLLATMAPIVRDGKVSGRLAASTTRSILDSIAVRLDEARDITRYIASLLIFLGLLGTFWGLSNTVPAVVDTIRSLAPSGGDASGEGVFARLMSGLEDQLGGMGTAFASSLMGLAGSLVVGLLELFAGHGQNRFYRELEEWLSGFTRLGLVSEGEGPDGALVALLERVDEGLQRTSEAAARADADRAEADKRLGMAADALADLAKRFEQEQGMVAELVREIREARDGDSGRERALIAGLRRIEQSTSQTAASQGALVEALSKNANGSGGDVETRTHLRNLDKQLRILTDDLANGRHETTSALRQDLRTLVNLIDARIRAPGAH
ncbi:MAG: biopolymer transporter ExbB [Pseudomonadota bacterium]